MLWLVQLNKLDHIIERKLKLLQMYKDRLKDIDGLRIIEPNNSKSNHVPFRVVIMCEESVEDLMKAFEENEIETRSVFYPLHKQPCYSECGDDVEQFIEDFDANT